MIKFFAKHKLLSNLLLILFINLLILTFQVKDTTERTLFSKIITTLLTPPQAAADFTLRWIADRWNRYIALRNYEAENRELKDKIRKLEEQLVMKEHLENRIRSLEDLLKFQQEQTLVTEPAMVTGTTPSYQYKSFYINKGNNVDIKRFDPVINQDGLVGFVVMTAPISAQVQTVRDISTAVAVVTGESRIRGIVRGGSGNLLTMDYVEKLENVRIGEKVYTSGLDHIYPAGILVGKISNIGVKDELFQEIFIESFVDFNRIDSVLVIKVTAENLAPDEKQPGEQE